MLPRLDKKKVSSAINVQSWTFCKESTGRRVDSKKRYSQFKIKDWINQTRTKAVGVMRMSCYSCVDASWMELVMMICFAECDATDAETQFALYGVIPSVALTHVGRMLKEKPLYDWFVKPVGMHSVPPPITGTFMPPSNKPDIDDTQFTYGSKSNNSSDTNSERLTYVPAGKGAISCWLHNIQTARPMTRPKKSLLFFNSLVGLAHITKWIWTGEDGELLLRPQQVVLGKVTGHICIGDPRTMVDLNNLQDKECLVLSKEFQLPDSSQVVLRVPRRHNLYCFNLTDIHSEREIKCLLAKASLD
ncbi:hypothetical protein Tco_0848214 [Tanacetum coccineum]